VEPNRKKLGLFEKINEAYFQVMEPQGVFEFSRLSKLVAKLTVYNQEQKRQSAQKQDHGKSNEGKSLLLNANAASKEGKSVEGKGVFGGSGSKEQAVKPLKALFNMK
jgi:hypothetical protein